MPGERLPGSTFSQPLAHGDVAAVHTPIAVLAALVPPAVHPVSAERPSLAEIELDADVGHGQDVIKHVCLDGHVERFPFFLLRYDSLRYERVRFLNNGSRINGGNRL